MLITNLPDIRNKEYEIIGLVEGDTVFAKNIGKDLVAGVKNVIGGEVTIYTELFQDAKLIALKRLEANAKSLNADAILNMQYSITNLQGGSAFVVNVIGTAVKYINN